MSEQQVSKKQKRRLKKRKILRKVAQRTQKNKSIMKKVKVLIKNTRKSILYLKSNYSEENKVKVDSMLREVVKEIDKACSKNVIHKNEASRRKSRIMNFYNKVIQSLGNLSKV
ncbi:MAG: 30S ribosomal protein S20 [bacterium]